MTANRRSEERVGEVVVLHPNANAATGRAPALEEAFERFFDAHFGYVIHSLRRLGVRERDVDDVAQDVFLSLHRRFAEYDPNRSARGWLYAFIAHTAANYRRLARHRREQVLDDVDPSTSDDDPELNTHRAVQAAFIRDVLLDMSEDRRTALVLHDLDGLTAPEISDALKVPLNTVYSRVRRARADFKRIAHARLSGEER